MQNIWNRLIYLYDSSGDRLDQGWPIRSSLIHGLQYQGKLTYLTFTERKLSDQKSVYYTHLRAHETDS